MKKFSASFVAAALAMTIAVPVLAADAGMVRKDMVKKAVNVDAACMQNAVEKRDSAMWAAVDTYSSTVKTALAIRKDALKAAWALTDKTQRNTANKAAWTAFQGTWKKASTAMKAARKNAWAAFRTDTKTCKQTGVDTSGESTDNSI